MSLLGKPTQFNAIVVGTNLRNGQNDLNLVFGISRVAVWRDSDHFSDLPRRKVDSAPFEQLENVRVAGRFI